MLSAINVYSSRLSGAGKIIFVNVWNRRLGTFLSRAQCFVELEYVGEYLCHRGVQPCRNFVADFSSVKQHTCKRWCREQRHAIFRCDLANTFRNQLFTLRDDTWCSHIRVIVFQCDGEAASAPDTLEADIGLCASVVDSGHRNKQAQSTQSDSLHEIEIAASLNHPNIRPLHASGEAEGLLYYVMPFVEGASLRERLTREKHLPLEEAVRIIREVADALSYAHESHLVHRDIKPENILFTAGHAVVADFGIAKALNVAGGDRLTQTGLSVGTPTYMSPEQAAGTEAVDARSDLYSLACLAYEMLGGEPPFTGPTPQAVLARHAVDPVPKLGTIRPSVPAGVAKAIEKALAKVPADRFPTARAFAEAVEKASTDEAIAAEVEKRERAAGRRRLRVIGTTLALVVLGVWAFLALISPTYERLAVMPPANLLNDLVQEHLMQGVHEALIEELQRTGVSVKARTAMMRYRDVLTPPRDVADELGVDALIEPSVRWDADSVEIDLRLVDGDTEEYIGDPIGRAGQVQDVMSLYSELVRDVVHELQLDLSAEAEARVSNAEPVNPAAYDDYLNGRFHWNRITQAGMETALGYFQQALEKEPNFAQAHAGVAQVWAGRQQMGYASPAEAGPQAREALALALAADSALFEVQYVAALVRTWVNWDWEGGEESFRKTIALNPDFADARAYYSNLLMFLDRREECERQAERAIALDPLKPVVQALQGHVLMFRNRLDEAVSVYLDALQATPDNPVPRCSRGPTPPP